MGTRDFQNSPPFEGSVCFYMTISESIERFQYATNLSNKHHRTAVSGISKIF